MSVGYDVDGWDAVDIDIYNSIVLAEGDAVSRARNIIDRYWVKLDEANRTILGNRKIGQDTERKVAFLAPVVEVSANTGRSSYRLIWQTFEAKGYQRVNRGAGRRIPCGKGVYEFTYNPNTLLKHSVGWDAKAIIEAEGLLEPIRLALKSYQRIIVTMAARYRRTNKLTKKREGIYDQ